MQNEEEVLEWANCQRCLEHFKKKEIYTLIYIHSEKVPLLRLCPRCTKQLYKFLYLGQME